MTDKIKWTHTTEVLENWGQKLIQEYRGNLSSDGHNYTNNLEQTLKYFVRAGKTSLILELNLNAYYKFLERGRGKTDNKGGGVVVREIAKWLKIKHILPRPNKNGKLPTQTQLAYAIATNIHKGEGFKKKDGSYYKPLQKAMDSVKVQFMDALHNAIELDVTENVKLIINTFFSSAPSLYTT